MGVVRQTKSVKAILNAFDATNAAISSTELVEHFSDKMNKTTVYRILERLVDQGVLHAFKANDGVSMYAKCHGCSTHEHTDLHPHFQCEKCGETKCLPLEIKIPSLPNYQIDSAELLLTGTCDNCK